MRLICIAAMALLFHSCQRKTSVQISPASQTVYTDPRGNAMLLGMHTKEDLQQMPYKEWFEKNYADYAVDSVTAARLTPFLKNKKFEIFMGTWCGDSRREVPGMFKILASAGVRPAQIKMIMVDDHDSTYKQSPGHEERGKSIHRVPDLIVYSGKKEINRIVEYPVVSLEKDLLAIVNGSGYQPNYRAATYLLQHAQENNMDVLLKDTASLIENLKGLVKNSAELNSLGYVWMSAGEMDKAMMVFQLNAQLFPAVANVYDSLGEINMQLHNGEAAKKYYLKVLQMNPGSVNAARRLSLLN